MNSALAASTIEPIRVMVVDDSAVIRGFIVRTLEADPEIEVVASCANGAIALQQLAKAAPDVVILDIEMPVMDGLTALPKLLAADPGLKVVMASTLTQRNAEVSLKALTLGASDYLPKPSAASPSNARDFHHQLREKIRVLGWLRRKQQPMVKAPVVAAPPAPTLRKQQAHLPPKLLVIGSSTGGPQALTEVLTALPASFSAPILIAQHMPPTFTAVLAQHLSRSIGRPCSEAKADEPVVERIVRVAPGGCHMEIALGERGLKLRLSDAPPENFCKPSVNPLFRTAAKVAGAGTVAVMLTGMGADGLEGARDVAAAGGTLIAQDEATSVVWGMPGAVATAGLCNDVLPLKSIAPHLAQLFGSTQ
jgi:two-component system chemotaxis response regulator CheB